MQGCSLVASGLGLRRGNVLSHWCLGDITRLGFRLVRSRPLSTSSFTYGTASSFTYGTAPFVGGFHPWVRFVIWLVLIAVWVGVFLTLLRSPPLEITSDEPS